MPDAAVFDVTRFFTSLDEEEIELKNNYPGCGWPRVALSIVKQLQNKYSKLYGTRPEGNNTIEHDKYDMIVIRQIVQLMTDNAPYSNEENYTSRQITDIQNALVTAIARENVFSLLMYCDTDDNIRNYWNDKEKNAAVNIKPIIKSAMTSDLFFVKSMTSTAVQKHLHYLMVRNMHMSMPSDHQLRDVWFYKQQYVALGIINQWCVRRYLQSVQGAEKELEEKCGIDRKWVNLRPEWFDTSTALLTFARLYVRNSEYAKKKLPKTSSSEQNEQEKTDVKTQNKTKNQEHKIKTLTEKNSQLEQDKIDIMNQLNASKTVSEKDRDKYMRILNSKDKEIYNLKNDKVELQEELDILKQANDGKKEKSDESGDREEIDSDEKVEKIEEQKQEISRLKSKIESMERQIIKLHQSNEKLIQVVQEKAEKHREERDKRKEGESDESSKEEEIKSDYASEEDTREAPAEEIESDDA